MSGLGKCQQVQTQQNVGYRREEGKGPPNKHVTKESSNEFAAVNENNIRGEKERTTPKWLWKSNSKEGPRACEGIQHPPRIRGGG